MPRTLARRLPLQSPTARFLPEIEQVFQTNGYYGPAWKLLMPKSFPRGIYAGGLSIDVNKGPVITIT